ncbi:MAG: hypothetical protein ACSHW0_12785 [Thalassotalea sp.]
MKSLKLSVLLLLTSFFLSQQVCAGAIYSAESTASISLNSSSPGDLSFVNVIGNYSALATAFDDGTLAIDSEATSFGRSESYDTLAELLSAYTSVFPSPFGSVNAVIGGASSGVRNEAFSSANVARFQVEAFGKTTDPVELAYARGRWDVLIAFENTSSNNMSFSWDLNYLFENFAETDANGTAFSTSRVRARQGTFVNGERNNNPKIYEAVTGVCGSTTECLPGSNDGVIFSFDYNLGAGDIGFLNFDVVAEGSALTVSEPVITWFFGTALIMSVGLINRRKCLALNSFN